tara:strand:+ start:9000 stop:9590 length:591 start_codon:yes stop_codon:yes gene_type:complete
MGCGCGSSFSGKTQKKCSCGRNEGGMCQCNKRKLNASGKQYPCRDIYGGIYYSDKPCVNEYGVAAKQGGNGCQFPCYPCPNGRGCCGVTDYGSCSDHSPKQAQGVSPKAKSRKDRMMNFHHSKSNFSSKQVGFEDVRSRFNAFMGVTPQPQVDIKKYNIPQDEYYSYNDYYSGMGGAMSGGFKTQWNKNNDLEVEF